MPTGTDEGEPTVLSPDDAFATLGNETRMEILQTLGEADDPLSFSELRDRIGMRDSGQFNYPLDKLKGHFIRQTDGGYTLRQAGTRIIEAVLSGAVTDAPIIAPTEVDAPCLYCDAPIMISYREESLRMYCTECSGTYGDAHVEDDPSRHPGIDDPDVEGYLGELSLPPAAV